MLLSSVACAVVGVVSEQPWPNPRTSAPVFSSNSFVVLGLEFIFLRGVR